MTEQTFAVSNKDQLALLVECCISGVNEINADLVKYPSRSRSLYTRMLLLELSLRACVATTIHTIAIDCYPRSSDALDCRYPLLPSAYLLKRPSIPSSYKYF
jgi:hypothetical protein